MTAPRIDVRGATLAISRRTVLRKALLGWWHPMVDTIFLYALAKSAQTYDVALHFAVRVLSHYHLQVTPQRELCLGEFQRQVNHDISCALNALLEREGYDPPGQIFDGRRPHQMRLMDAEAQMAQLLYDDANPYKAGLVESSHQLPGLSLSPRLWKREPLRIPRPDIYFGRNSPAEVELDLQPPAQLWAAFGGDIDALVYHFETVSRDVRRAVRDERSEEGLGGVRGAEALQHIHPYDEPRTLKEPSGERIPSFRTGKRGIEGCLARERGAREVSGYRDAYRGSYQQHCENERRKHAADAEVIKSDANSGVENRPTDGDIVFPYGTYEMRRRYGVVVSEPAFEAWVTAPEPTLRDLKQLTEGGGVALQRDMQLIDRVREHLEEDAAAVEESSARRIEQHRSRKEQPPGSGTSANAADQDTASGSAVENDEPKRRRPPAETTTRQAHKPRRSLEEAPRRTVTLRHSAEAQSRRAERHQDERYQDERYHDDYGADPESGNDPPVGT